MSDLIVAPAPAPLSKKERKRARKMSRGGGGGGGAIEATLQPAVTARVVERVATAGTVRLWMRPQFDEIDGNKALKPEEKIAAKKKLAWQALIGGLIGEQMLGGNFGRASTGASSAGAAMLGFLY